MVVVDRSGAVVVDLLGARVVDVVDLFGLVVVVVVGAAAVGVGVVDVVAGSPVAGGVDAAVDAALSMGCVSPLGTVAVLPSPC